MARRAEEAENHWPGFVDALSTIVMVVTFLLIILGIVIFVISQNIAKDMMRTSKSAEETQTQQSAGLKQTKKNSKQSKQQKPSSQQAESQDAQSDQSEDQQAQSEQVQEQQAQSRQQAANKTQSKTAQNKAAAFRQQMSDRLTHDEKNEAEDKLAVRSRKVDSEKRIVIATEEKSVDVRDIHIKTSQVMLTLVFAGGVKITDKVSSDISSFMQANKQFSKDGKFEVRAFANAGNRSISEVRRLAYYRALATRNELLGLGVEASRIALKVTLSDRAIDKDAVKIYLK